MADSHAYDEALKQAANVKGKLPTFDKNICFDKF